MWKHLILSIIYLIQEYFYMKTGSWKKFFFQLFIYILIKHIELCKSYSTVAGTNVNLINKRTATKSPLDMEADSYHYFKKISGSYAIL